MIVAFRLIGSFSKASLFSDDWAQIYVFFKGHLQLGNEDGARPEAGLGSHGLNFTQIYRLRKASYGEYTLSFFIFLNGVGI